MAELHTSQELVACVEGLWSLPDVYYRVREAIEDPDVSTDELARLVSADPALAGTLLRLANSAFFGFPRRIETLSRAISLIGLDEVTEAVLASVLAASFSSVAPIDLDMRRFWRGSVRRGLLCRHLSRLSGDREGERLFVAGLLSDTGHLVMCHAIPDVMRDVLSRPATLGQRAERERELAGCDFAEVGAALIVSWRLPSNLGTLIGAQLMPPYAGDLAHDAARVHIAAVLSEAIETRMPTSDAIGCLHPEALSLAGVDAVILNAAIEQAETQLGEVLASLGLQP
ncbi:MAG: HDOD domain-containing protein [Moraxellaceae bacterium]|nr:HDOD domain-containing protein [Moraxellaceae bacterium]